MEKEKILKQLEEKLLPSVQNLEKGQATEHDYFPALLWLLLDKSNDTEKILTENQKSHEELVKSGVNFISGKNLENHNQLLEKNKDLNKTINELRSLIYISAIFHVLTLTCLGFVILNLLKK